MKPVIKIADSFFSTSKTHYAFLDGKACQSLEKAYTCLEDQLLFPDYFSHNLDSLDELLSDLEWIPQKRIRLVISNSKSLLSKNPEKKEAFIDTLNEHQNERLEIFYLSA